MTVSSALAEVRAAAPIAYERPAPSSGSLWPLVILLAIVFVPPAGIAFLRWRTRSSG